MGNKNYSVNVGGTRANDPNGATWKPSAVKNLAIKVDTQVPAGGTTKVRGLSTSISVAQRPQVKSPSISPSNAITFDTSVVGANNTYSVNWEYYDHTGLPQSGYEVNIYPDSVVSNPSVQPNRELALVSAVAPSTNNPSADATTFEISASHGYLSGYKYWAFVTVSKTVGTTIISSNPVGSSFVVTIAQPQPPIVSVHADGTKARNVISIQSTDNLFSANSSSFNTSQSSWSPTVADTASTTIGVAVSPVALSTQLSTTTPLSFLPVGAVGGLGTGMSSSGLGSILVTGSASTTGTVATHTTFTGNITSGSATITGVSSADVSKIQTSVNGQRTVLWSSTGITAGTTILGVHGSASATTFTVTMSAKATVTQAGAAIMANYPAAADAIGFPTGGQFWIQIDSERMLVSNNANGNNTGDTFTIITRGYLGTTGATHSVGATVYYGLQSDVYTGWSGEIVQAYDRAVGLSTTHTGTASPSNGHTQPVSAHSPTVSSTTQTLQATLKLAKSNAGVVITDGGKVIYVNDPQNVLRAGQTVELQYAVPFAKVKDSLVKNGSITLSPSNPRAVQYRTSQSVIKSIAMAGEPVNDMVRYGVVASDTFYDSIGSSGPITRIPVNVGGEDWIRTHTIPKGSTVYIRSNWSYTLPNGTTKNGDRYWTTTITKAFHENDTYLYIAPAKNAGAYNVNGGFFIPHNATFSFKALHTPTALKRVTLKTSLNQGSFKGVNLKKNDPVFVYSSTAISGGGGGGGGGGTPTTYSSSVSVTSVDFTQGFVVDYNQSALPFTLSATLGNLSVSGTTFTPISSGSTSVPYNALRIPSSSTAYTGYLVDTSQGMPSPTSITGVIGSGTFTILALSQTASPPPASVSYSGTATTFNYANSANINFYPPNYNVISATSGTLPVTAIPISTIIPMTNFLRHTSVRIFENPKYGNFAMSAVASTTGTMDFSIYKNGVWSSSTPTSDNAIAVNAGATYGFAAVGTGQSITGTNTPQMSLYIDWYDSFGNELATSDGKTSLVNGATGSFTASVPLGMPLSANPGWIPNAIAAVAPTVALASSATYNASQGSFTLPSNSNPALSAGSSILVDGSAVTLTASASVSATTLYVSFINGFPPADGSTHTLTVPATYATPRIRVTNVNSKDALAFCGLMFKSLTTANPSSPYTVVSSQLPSIVASVPSTANAINAFAIPKATPTSGEDSIYLFDPTNDNGSREIHFGSGSATLATTVGSPSIAGSANLVINNTTGLGIGSTLTVGSGLSNTEIVTIDSGWDGSTNLTLTAPLLNAHVSGETATAYTTGTSNGLSNSQPVGTPVAVFNWNNEGYINSPNCAYNFQVERSDDAGKTYTTIYGGTNLVADSTGATSVIDVEVTPNINTYYRITPSFVPPSGGKTVAGVPAIDLQAPSLSTSTWWIASTTNPDLRFPILVQNALEETQKHPVGVFYPLGSSRPIVLPGVVQGRDAKITFIWTDIPNWDNLISLLNSGETLILTDPVESLKRYIALDDDVNVTHNSGGAPYRTVQLSYVEAPPPTGWYYNFGQ